MSENKTPTECEISSDGKCICESDDDCKECPVYGKWLYEECRSLATLCGTESVVNTIFAVFGGVLEENKDDRQGI